MRTPTLLQMEAVECGAACLGIVLRHYGRYVPLAELRRECGVSRDGSNASSIAKAGRRFGLEVKGYSKEVEGAAAIEPPFVAFWNFNHFVVVDGFAADGVHLNDPATGHRKVDHEEFEDAFTGVVLVMRPGPEFEKGGRPPSLVHALLGRLRGFHGALAYAVLAGFLLVVPGLLFPAFTQVFIDHVLIAARSEWLRPLLLAMVAAAAVHGVLTSLQLVALRRFRLGLSARLSTRFFEHLLKLPADFYAQRYSGEISDRTELNDKVAGVLSGQLARTLIDVVMMVFYAALMLFYEPRLTALTVVFAALNFVALRRVSKWRVEANMRVLQEFGKVNGTSIAGLQSIETIKASAMESGFFHRWSGHYANASNARQEIELSNQLLGRLPDLLASIASLLVLSVGGWFVIQGRMTIGMLVAFRILTMSFLGPVGSLVHLGQTIQELDGDLMRLDDVLANPIDPGEEGGDGGEEGADQQDGRVRLRGAVELRGLTFGYNPTAPPLIEDFGLSLAPGQKVALVGGSGSGKSTVARLVCGLYQPWSGEVLLDGTPRTALPRALVTSSLSLVDQDLLLFGGSVRDNLTLWDPTVPRAKLEEAARDAEIYDRIQALPGGFEGRLSEGGQNLSGGERQRLEIARALVNDPSILVLDEATSALDTESERRIVENVALRGCSCLIVAHRLSTIRDCDEIIVLEQGKVVERGTHEELWRRGGVYAGLLRSDEGEHVTA